MTSTSAAVKMPVNEEEMLALGLRSLGTGEPPLQGAFFRRAIRAVFEITREMEESSLQKAVSAPSDYGALLAALESEPGLALLGQSDPLARARMRGIEARSRLLNHEGGTLGAQEVADSLRVTRQAVYKRYRTGRLLALRTGRHGLVFPAWQFVEGGVLPGLDETLRALDEDDPWVKLAFFLGSNMVLCGRTPLEALQQGDVEGAVHAASIHGEQGAI